MSMTMASRTARRASRRSCARPENILLARQGGDGLVEPLDLGIVEAHRLAPARAASTARALGSGSFRPPSRVWSGRTSWLPSSLTARHDDRALQVSQASAKTDHRPHRDLDPRRGDLMPPTRPTLVDSTPRFGRSASSRGAAPALLLVPAGASTVQGGIGKSPAPALQASFGPGQITRHGSFR